MPVEDPPEAEDDLTESQIIEREMAEYNKRVQKSNERR